jgi:hypothetical protein
VATEAEDVGEGDLDALVAREVNACDASHSFLLTLTLLVASVAADDPDDTLALDDLALGADWFDGSSYFHGSFLSGDRGGGGLLTKACSASNSGG